MEHFDGCSVIFHNILEWYSPTENISCNFSLKTLINSEEQVDCFVAIFHVGWDSLEANITKRSFSLCENLSEKNYQVVFPPNELPQHNPDEFYQFCFYNIKSEVVYGASCPFQICSRGDEPFIVCAASPRERQTENKSDISMSTWMAENSIEINEEEDFATVMVVKKNQTEENLLKFKLENEILCKSNESLKNEFEKSAFEINRLKHEIEIRSKNITLLEKSIQESEKIINHLNEQMKRMKEEIITDYEAKIGEMNTERDSLESDRAKAHLEIDILRNELKEKEKCFNSEIVQVKNELALEKQSYKLMQDQHQSTMERLGQTENAYGEGMEEAKHLQMKLNEVELQIKSEKEKNMSISFDLENLTKTFEETKEEHKLKETDMKNIQNNLKEECNVMKEELTRYLQIIETLTTENSESKQKETALSRVNTDLNGRIQELEHQFEEVCKLKTEEFNKLTAEIERQAELIHESNSQLHILEMQLDEKNKQVVEMKNDFQEERGQTEIILEELRSKVEELQENQVVEQAETNKPKPSTMTKSEGSYYALQVAYNFVQKQLKQFKTENEELRKMTQGASALKDLNKSEDTISKENTDLKLRLEYGKQAFEKKFKECEKLKSDLKTSKKRSSLLSEPSKFDFVELKEENEKIKAELAAVKQRFAETQNIEIELKRQLQKQNNRIKKFEDESNLIVEENKLLKAQVSALLEGGATATIRRKFDPSMQSQTKPTNIAYPPSMNKIERDLEPIQQYHQQQQLKLYQYQHQHQQQHQQQHQHQQQPPRLQTIPNRQNPEQQQHIQAHILHGRGQVSPVLEREDSRPTCPVCALKFPVGFTDATANKHVNEHFQN